jgi:hypothetical protein
MRGSAAAVRLGSRIRLVCGGLVLTAVAHHGMKSLPGDKAG